MQDMIQNKAFDSSKNCDIKLNLSLGLVVQLVKQLSTSFGCSLKCEKV